MPTHSPSFGSGPAEPETRTRSLLAIVLTCLVLVMVATMVGLIGYRSVTIHTPSTALVVSGDASLDGAKIQVTDLDKPHSPWTAWIDRADEWQSPILLDPGRYHISVTHRGKEILSEDFAPDRLYGVRFDLPSLVLIIGNRALADGRVEITYSGDNTHIARSTEIKFSANEHYRQGLYLMPGDYRAIAHSPPPHDQVLAQTDFVVDHASPIRIDLAKVYSEGAE